MAHPAAGAVVVFQGVGARPRPWPRRAGTRLRGHPTPRTCCARWPTEIAADPAVLAVAVSHRIGQLAIGDVAIVAAVSTAHRGDAFAICERLVDEAKARLPIWKRQLFDDGTDEWVNCP